VIEEVKLDQFIQYLFAGLTMGVIYALTAVGFNLIYNATGVVNFAQGELVMLGAMFLYTLQEVFHLPPFISLPTVFFLGALVGVFFELGVVKPLLRLGIITVIIGTIGASVVLKGAAMLVWGKDALAVRALLSEKPLSFLGANINTQVLVVLAVTSIVVLLLWYFVGYTMVGRAIRACSINTIAAQLSGIPVELMITISFCLSGGFSALAGGLIAPITLAEYDMGTMLALKGFCAAIIGGLGNNTGALVGGLLLGVMEGMSAGYLSSAYKDALAFLILILVLFWRPEGLITRGTGERV